MTAVLVSAILVMLGCLALTWYALRGVPPAQRSGVLVAVTGLVAALAAVLGAFAAVAGHG